MKDIAPLFYGEWSTKLSEYTEVWIKPDGSVDLVDSCVREDTCQNKHVWYCLLLSLTTDEMERLICLYQAWQQDQEMDNDL